MSEINTTTSEPLHPLFALLGDMSAAAKAHLPKTVELFKKTAEDKLVNANAEKLATAVTNYTAIDRALKAIKPTPLGYDNDGKPVSEVFTKEQGAQKKQLLEAKTKALKILGDALTTGDFSQLGNIKAPQGAKPAADAGDESAA